MTVVIAPDPTTRECPKHPGQLQTDTLPCICCEVDRIVNEFSGTLAAAIHEAVSCRA